MKIKPPLPSSDFPQLLECTYLDSAATTLKPRSVVKRLSTFYMKEYGPVGRSVHLLGETATAAYEKARETVASFVKAPSHLLAFTSGTTHSLSMLAHSFSSLKQGKKCIVSDLEHHSHFLAWHEACKKTGADLVIVPLSKKEGKAVLLKEINENTACVSLTLCSNILGEVWEENFTDLHEIIAYAKKKGAYVFLDGAQAVPFGNVNFISLGADALAFSAHKMLGPTGVGALCLSPEYAGKFVPPFVGGGSVEQVTFDSYTPRPFPWGAESGTPPVAQAVGFAAAVEYLTPRLHHKTYDYLQELSKIFLEEIQKISEVIPVPHPVPSYQERSHLFSFYVPHIHAHDLAHFMSYHHKVMMRAGYHCCQPFFSQNNLPPTMRASFYLYTSKEDIYRAIYALREAITFYKTYVQ